MAEHTLYFHGIPGSAGELNLFGDGLSGSRSGVQVVDRSVVKYSPENAAGFNEIAQNIKVQFPGASLRLIGFSLGASAALRTAIHLGSQVSHIDLISAAAPLSLGDYLPNMAGAPVFRLARFSPALFKGLSGLQSAAAKLAPNRLYDMLFASAQGDDFSLSKDLAFRTAMLPILQSSLGTGLATYRREIALYMQDWGADLAQVKQPVTLYHGKADNWSPVSMAQDLASSLPRAEAVHLFDGLSHYSTLREYWRRYFTQPSPMVS